jgi:ubiquinone/menaquinone biosynthesis C-methylase UbiE
MTDLVLRSATLETASGEGAQRDAFALELEFEVLAEAVFELDVSIDLVEAESGARRAQRQYRSEGRDPSWLPRGRYRCAAYAPRRQLPAGRYRAELALWHQQRCTAVKVEQRTFEFVHDGDLGAGTGPVLAWDLQSLPGTTPVAEISWRKGHADWFYKHFDHAARTTMSYMLGDSPLLAGRILDVGCGDGITDLGIALRRQPECLVGIDPFRGYERLLEVARAAHLPLARLPENLEFLPADANHIPFPDDSFDVVISWGSLEHIAGGYARALAEIRRVLRPDGLLFVHPGLFYSDVGSHLGEFPFAQAEPYVHLKKSHAELERLVLGGEPLRMDRSGHVATPAEYWQWYNELNRITVRGFEGELRALGFEPWRAAIRTHERVDYTPELLPYSIQDLAEAELYLSAYNRKARSAGS